MLVVRDVRKLSISACVEADNVPARVGPGGALVPQTEKWPWYSPTAGKTQGVVQFAFARVDDFLNYARRVCTHAFSCFPVLDPFRFPLNSLHHPRVRFHQKRKQINARLFL